MNAAAGEPRREVVRDGVRYTLLGTAHVSRASADAVRALLATEPFDAVAVELCPSRYQSITDPDAIARLDLFRVIREGKAPMIAANLALSAFQQRLAEQFGVQPGDEFRAAIAAAGERGMPVALVDRDIGVTLRRIYRAVPWWRRLTIGSGLLASLLVRDDVSAQDIERLKSGDILESVFAELTARARDLYEPLIAERDRYMAARLRAEYAGGAGKRVLVVVGAGHLAGLERALREDADAPQQIVAALDVVAPPGPWPRRLAWMFVAAILAGFAFGFARSPELGWRLLADWVLINGGLAALGAFVAAAHPLTILASFCAAPLTSLNPTVGVGMAAAAVEAFLRRPTVGDFARLREDTSHLAGWRRNRVARTFAVFVLSSLGSAIGTWVASLRILDRLTG